MDIILNNIFLPQKNKFFIISLIVIIYAAYDLWKKHTSCKQLGHFYSKPSLPVVGHVHHIIDKFAVSMTKILAKLLEWKFPALVWIFHVPVVVIATPPDMKVVLNTTRNRGKMMEKVHNTLGNGIISLAGEKWHRSRRIVNMALSPSNSGVPTDFRHPEKVYQEIKSVIENTVEPIKMNDLDRLVYLEQSINEKPVPASFRQNHRDIVLNDKQTIPANYHIFIFFIGLHNNGDIYPNPDIWDPSRFGDEAVSKHDKYAFLPFATGPRSCPGARYAILSVKMLLVYLLRDYHFTTDMKIDDIKLHMTVELKNINGYWVKLHRRMTK